MAIIVTGHTVIAGTYNNLLPLPFCIPFAFSKHLIGCGSLPRRAA